MTPNQITVIRPLLSFWVLLVLGRHPTLDALLCVVIVGIFALDVLDGYLARKRKETSKIGGILDTLADRMIENTFWIYFSATGQLSVWMPIAVMTRGVVTDTLQRMHGYPTAGWIHALTRGHLSRAVYGMTKMLAFTSLASVRVFTHPVFEEIRMLLATVAVGVCLLRGLPFFLMFTQKPPKHWKTADGGRCPAYSCTAHPKKETRS